MLKFCAKKSLVLQPVSKCVYTQFILSTMFSIMQIVEITGKIISCVHRIWKNTFRTILTAFEEIIVPLWSITKLRADKEIGERLIKLKKLWTDNKYFSTEVEERFNMHIVEYKQVLSVRIRRNLQISSFVMV